MNNLRIQTIAKDIDTPTYAHEGDAGLDLRASGHFTVNLSSDSSEVNQEEITIHPKERILIKCGIILEIPKGHYGSIRDRSGLAAKQGLHVLAGVIDENYRGEIGVVLLNTDTKPHLIKKNDRIAQMVIEPYTRCDIALAENLSETNRGEKGYGSTGK